MREWLVTNGLGGYASLTRALNNTRKFHGILISSLEPPVKRWVFVSNVYEKIRIMDGIYNLSDYKSRFVFDMFPSFLYEINDVYLKKTIFMPYESNTTIIKYEVKTDKPIMLFHSPILTSRHFYDVIDSHSINFKEEITSDGIYLQPDNVDRKLKIILKGAYFNQDESWMEIRYDKDCERNDSCIDHVLKVGEFSKSIQKLEEYYMVFTIENKLDFDPAEICKKEIQRKKHLLNQANLPEHFNKLILSTDNFIVKKGTGKSIIAGYHWFGDWGRDTLISLPGLTLVTRRFDDAKNILLSFSKYCKNGLIPNAFMDRDSKAVYNTVDASLWYVDRVYQYLKYTNDQIFLEEIWSTLQSIVDSYKHGTDYDIHMDADSLISHGNGLTWMDVKMGDYYVTPRSKKAVEIQALWYNSLRIMSNLAKVLNRDDVYFDLAQKVKENFIKQFDQFYDVIDTKDLSLRPNQIFLVSLDFSIISEEIQKKIVKNVRDKLLTPFGLRTLSPDDPEYKGKYIGDYNKDYAYHNGTVWPWLIGPFIKAFIKTKKYDTTWRKYAYQIFLKPILDVMGDQWDGSIHEIYDGDPPYTPRGCISQAWSVAEVFRTWVEDIENKRPPYENIFLTNEISV